MWNHVENCLEMPADVKRLTMQRQMGSAEKKKHSFWISFIFHYQENNYSVTGSLVIYMYLSKRLSRCSTAASYDCRSTKLNPLKNITPPYFDISDTVHVFLCWCAVQMNVGADQDSPFEEGTCLDMAVRWRNALLSMKEYRAASSPGLMASQNAPLGST